MNAMPKYVVSSTLETAVWTGPGWSGGPGDRDQQAEGRARPRSAPLRQRPALRRSQPGGSDRPLPLHRAPDRPRQRRATVHRRRRPDRPQAHAPSVFNSASSSLSTCRRRAEPFPTGAERVRRTGLQRRPADHTGRGGRPWGDAGRIAVPLAGDDADAKRVVSELSTRSAPTRSTWAASRGASPIQPGAPLCAAHLTAEQMKRRLAAGARVGKLRRRAQAGRLRQAARWRA